MLDASRRHCHDKHPRGTIRLSRAVGGDTRRQPRGSRYGSPVDNSFFYPHRQEDAEAGRLESGRRLAVSSQSLPGRPPTADQRHPLAAFSHAPMASRNCILGCGCPPSTAVEHSEESSTCIASSPGTCLYTLVIQAPHGEVHLRLMPNHGAVQGAARRMRRQHPMNGGRNVIESPSAVFSPPAWPAPCPSTLSTFKG